MPKDAHNKAAEHHESAAKSHRAAAESHGNNDHAKGKEHATQAQQTRRMQTSIPRPRIRKVHNRSKNSQTRGRSSLPGPSLVLRMII